MNDQTIDLDPANNFLPAELANIHIMGIGGTAMAALAGMLTSRGFRVSGSDRQIYPPMSDFLKQIDVRLFNGYQAENLAYRPDLVVVGNVITRVNPEAQELARSGLPYLSMPQVLGHLFIENRRSLVITGTHGKTTTSSMLASALATVGADPGFMIGGILRDFDANFRIGKGSYFVTEGDEYDTAFFDKGSKFLHYRPEIAVITSIEFDHADIFADLEAIKRSFRKFVALMPPDGLIIANLDDEHVAEIVREAPCQVQGYGLQPGRDWLVANCTFEPGRSAFDLIDHGKHFARFTIQPPGRYNCLNAAAVAVLLNHLGYTPQQIGMGLQGFGGVKRRQEIRGRVNGVTVMDDFAHHPTAVRETIGALKQAYPDNRLIAVFEPRTNTSRRSIFQQEYAASFDGADLSVIRKPVPASTVSADDIFSAERLAADLSARGKNACAFEDTDQIIAFLSQTVCPGDLVVILSNGGFDNIHQRLLETLRNRASS